MNIIETLASEMNIPVKQVENTVALLDEGNTVPFIARYRKEVTGGLDDTVLRTLTDKLTYLRSLEQRKAEVRSLIEGQGVMTPEIDAAITQAVTLTEVDDIYRPYRPKRKTRASVARERGLEPLAQLLLEQNSNYTPDLEMAADAYISEENGVPDRDAALQGARDIIAEIVSDNADYRKRIRQLTFNYGTISSKKVPDAADEAGVYEIYYDYQEPLKAVPGHRILAMNRGEREDILKVSVSVDADIVLNDLFYQVVTNAHSPAFRHVAAAVCDSYDRLIAPSIEREIRTGLFDDASEGAIKVFSENLKNLLMQATLKGKTVLGYDPGYRTGCKLAVVDKTGMVLDTAVIYPTKPREDIDGSRRIVTVLIKKYHIDVVAIGNGTASAESEMFIADLLRDLGADTKYIIVSEAGASVYSASKQGAEEFPDFDVTQRSAVSIARRLQDPLAELVKIDPKSIGVVEDCVNSVGVDVNTASYSLLSYISGINLTAAKNIVKYRDENGEFTSRSQLTKVPRIGAKAYEQCAGFLRVPDAKEILDNTGVHPESYKPAKALLAKFGYTNEDVRNGKLQDLRRKVADCGTSAVAEDLGIGEPTLLDIVAELEKPGRDIRDDLPKPQLRERVIEISDLEPGMVMTGTVRNVIDFGAFVDIGVHQDGLVHISEICDKFIKHPSEALSVGDIVTVKIKSVDVAKKRIGLTMKEI